MKRIVFLTLLIALLTGKSQALEHVYKVFYVKGNISIQQGSTKSILHKDQLVFVNDLILVQENSMLVLLNLENKPLVIEKKGSYNSKQIKELFLSIDQDNLSQKYFTYVVEEFLSHHGAQTYTGAVSRGKEIFMLSPADSCIIISEPIRFKWSNPGGNAVWFMIYDLNGNRLFDFQAIDSSFQFDESNTVLKKGESYLWMVSMNQFPGKNDLLNVLSITGNEQTAWYEKQLNDFKESLMWDYETNLLFLYAFYQQNKLFSESEKVLQLLKEEYPENILFNE